jgi:hypothetical protein
VKGSAGITANPSARSRVESHPPAYFTPRAREPRVRSRTQFPGRSVSPFPSVARRTPLRRLQAPASSGEWLTGAPPSYRLPCHAMNVFEGARRIALLIGALWVMGCVVLIGASAPNLSLEYAVSAFGATPKLAADCDYSRDAMQYATRKLPSTNETVSVTLCFKASKSEDGRMLVPYALRADGLVWMNGQYSSEVSHYTRAVADAFQIDADGIALAERQKTEQRSANIVQAIKFALVGLAIGWAMTFALGWIVRGFMGIPTGRDSKARDAD